MRPHHTKNKGDLGVLAAQLDLAKRGYGVLAPLTEHESFDLVAYKAGNFWRVQVKYRAAVDGGIELRFKTFWADRNGVHGLPMDKKTVDVVCVYCPDTDACYYVDPKRFRDTVRLRLVPTRNKQTKGVLWAEHFKTFPPLRRARQDSNLRTVG